MPYSGPSCTAEVRDWTDRVVGWTFRWPEASHKCGKRKNLEWVMYGYRCPAHYEEWRRTHEE
jgi:hypothetical protein